jgi:hypothetical protein
MSFDQIPQNSGTTYCWTFNIAIYLLYHNMCKLLDKIPKIRSLSGGKNSVYNEIEDKYKLGYSLHSISTITSPIL